MFNELASDIEGVCIGPKYYHKEEADYCGVEKPGVKASFLCLFEVLGVVELFLRFHTESSHYFYGRKSLFCVPCTLTVGDKALGKTTI